MVKYRDPEAKIGDRICGNCERPLREHCKIHFVPCCPGKCPGPDPLTRALAGG